MKATKKATRKESGNGSAEERRHVETAVRAMAACHYASALDPFEDEKLRQIAPTLQIPYVAALLVYHSNVIEPPLSPDDIEEWEAAPAWVRSIVLNSVRQARTELTEQRRTEEKVANG